MALMLSYHFGPVGLIVQYASQPARMILYNQFSGNTYYRRKKGFDFGIKHTGVYIGQDVFGTNWFVHNHIESGRAVLVTGKQFAAGMHVELYHQSCTNTRETVMRKAMAYVQHGVQYHPVTNNCQTLVNDACHNTKHSPDAARIIGTIALALLVAGALSSDSPKTKRRNNNCSR